MEFYQRYILPKVVHLVCGSRPIRRQRAKIIPGAAGRVLEVGIGSGLNLPYYDPGKVSRVWGIDPSAQMLRMACGAARKVPFPVELIDHPGSDIPLPGASADTAVLTYALCTVPDPQGVLREVRRILRPGGALLFCEHGAAPDAGVRRWQERLDPLWSRLAGGCHLNRSIPALLEAAGFRIARLETGYLAGWRPASFNYRGQAVPR